MFLMLLVFVRQESLDLFTRHNIIGLGIGTVLAVIFTGKSLQFIIVPKTSIQNLWNHCRIIRKSQNRKALHVTKICENCQGNL